MVELLLWREKVALLSGLRATGEAGSGLWHTDVLVDEDMTKEQSKKEITHDSIIVEKAG
jgi:hypothetical protein